MIIFNQIEISSILIGFALATVLFGLMLFTRIKNHQHKGDSASEVSPLRLLENFDGMAYACNIDEQWTMTYVNSNAYKILGYTSEEVTNNQRIAYNEIIHPKYRDYVRNQFSEAIENHEDVMVDYLIITKNHQEKWVREEAQIIYNHLGEPVQIEGYIYDIEETKSLLYDKNIYQFKYQSLFEGIDIPLVVMTKDKIVDMNPSALGLFRVDSKRHMIGKHPIDIIDPSYHQFFQSRMQRIQETKTANLMTEYKLKRHDGSSFQAMVDAKPYFNHGVLFLNVLVTEKDDIVSQNQRLKKSERRNRDLLLYMKEGIGVFRLMPDIKDGELIYANQQFSHLMVNDTKNLLYKKFRDLFSDLNDSDIQHIFNRENPSGYQKELYDDMAGRHIQSYYYFNEEGELIVQLTNISKEKKLLKQHQEKKEKIDEILQATGTMIWNWDRSVQRLNFDLRTYDLLGYDREDSNINNPRKILFYLHPDDRKNLVNQLRDYFAQKIPFFSVEVRIQDAWGKYRWWMIRGKAIDYNNDIPTLISGTIQDVTHHKRKDEEIRFLSLHDQLTKVYNLRAFEEKVAAFDSDDKLPISLALVDVNGLKVFNDALNHSVGDELLVKTANTLSQFAKADDVVARVGGDEFVMMMPNTPLKDAEERFLMIHKALKQQRVSDIPISVSYGIEVKFNQHFTLHQIKDMADSKMYKQKFNGKDTRLSILEQISDHFFKTNQFEQKVVDKTHEYAIKLGKNIGLDLETLSILDVASQYYNIGIFSIRQDVIKDDRSFKQYEEIEYRKHVENGYRIMLATYRNERIAMAILHHHEKYNGQGYPSQLKSKKIPIASRIISICATYARFALLKQSNHEIINYIQKERGVSFDPELVDAFTKVIQKQTHEN